MSMSLMSKSAISKELASVNSQSAMLEVSLKEKVAVSFLIRGTRVYLAKHDNLSIRIFKNIETAFDTIAAMGVTNSFVKLAA